MIIGIILISTLCYLLIIGMLVFGFDKVPEFRLTDQKPSLKYSIVIPFRNEAKNLPKLLASLKRLSYPKSMFEVILINDESTDSSLDLIYSAKKELDIDIQVFDSVRSSGTPKKDAISLAISKTKYEWILTTDADCVLPKFWLHAYDEFISSKNLKMAAGPVMSHDFSSFLKRFQALDILSLQASTIGGFGIHQPFLCNAANMCYSKSFFLSLKGFEGNSEIASGDDIFLLQKAIKQDKSTIGYLKNDHAIVFTNPENSWKDLCNQRRRWASKTRHYKNSFGTLVGMFVFLMNAVLICVLVLAIAKVMSFKMATYILCIKMLIDFLMIYKSARFFAKESLLASYPFAALFYPFFSVYIAFTSTFKDYKWKGRQFSK